MLARVSAFMGCLAAVALAAIVSSTGCVTEAKPVDLRCPTTAQSQTYSTAGSCGPGGLVTVTTDPGYCTVDVENGLVVGLPPSGNFSGTASETKYLISGGNWSLLGESSDPSADPSSTTCTATASSEGGGLLTVNCSVNSCTPSTCDSFTCSQSSCVMHFTPSTASLDAGKPDTSTVDSGEADSGKADSGKADSGKEDSGEHDAHAD